MHIKSETNSKTITHWEPYVVGSNPTHPILISTVKDCMAGRRVVAISKSKVENRKHAITK